jgi:hypothetical protein
VEIIFTGEFHKVSISVYFYLTGHTMTTLALEVGHFVTEGNVSVLYGAV